MQTPKACECSQNALELFIVYTIFANSTQLTLVILHWRTDWLGASIFASTLRYNVWYVFASSIGCALAPRRSKVHDVYEPEWEKTYLLTYSPNEDSNQPARLRSLIRVFVVRMKKLGTLGHPKCAQRRFWSDCANAQADLNLRCAT